MNVGPCGHTSSAEPPFSLPLLTLFKLAQQLHPLILLAFALVHKYVIICASMNKHFHTDSSCISLVQDCTPRFTHHTLTVLSNWREPCYNHTTIGWDAGMVYSAVIAQPITGDGVIR